MTGSETRPEILVVDDDEDIRLALRARLRASGYRTLWAEDGGQALEVARRARPGLVLLDLGLPDEDGVSVLQRLRALRDDLPVVVLTARDEDRGAEACARAGAATYLQKPVETRELLGAIRSALAQNGGAP